LIVNNRSKLLKPKRLLHDLGVFNHNPTRNASRPRHFVLFVVREARVLHRASHQIPDFLRAVTHFAGGKSFELLADGFDDGVFDGGGSFF
jgi:hypothetical protein